VNGNIFFTTMQGVTYVIDGHAKVLDRAALLAVNDLGPPVGDVEPQFHHLRQRPPLPPQHEGNCLHRDKITGGGGRRVLGEQEADGRRVGSAEGVWPFMLASHRGAASILGITPGPQSKASPKKQFPAS